MGAPRPHASPLAWAIGLALAPAVALAGPAGPAAPAAPAPAPGGATPPGPAPVVVPRLGLAPDTISLQLRAGQDTAVVVAMRELAHTTETIVVAATRAERSKQTAQLRVEVVDQEEVAEKSAMTPGDITMM